MKDIKSYKWSIGIMSVVLIICYIITPTEHYKDLLIYYGQPLATMSYIAIIFSAIFVAIQAILFRNDYQMRIEHSEFEKSYKLAEYYAKTILPKTPFASVFLNRINLSIDPAYYSKTLQFRNFTADEAKKIFGDDVFDRFEKKWNEDIPVAMDFNIVEFFKISHLDLMPPYKVQQKNGEIDTQAQYIVEKNWFKQTILTGITYLMNELEYFSMYFCAGLATPDAVYLILHQTYIDFVKSAYLFICFQNSTVIGHEFYAHTIQLYNEWNCKSLKRDEQIKSVMQPEKPKKMHSAS